MLLVAFGVVAVVSGDCDGTNERGVPVLAVAAFAGWQEAEAGFEKHGFEDVVGWGCYEYRII